MMQRKYLQWRLICMREECYFSWQNIRDRSEEKREEERETGRESRDIDKIRFCERWMGGVEGEGEKMCKIMKSLLWPRFPSLTADPGCDSHTDAM